MALPVHAQTVEMEGPISQIRANSVQIMGSTVVINSNTDITTPTGTLTLAELASTVKLPLREQNGFNGGTGIAVGTIVANGTITATELFVEPAENVLLGAVTANNQSASPRVFKINGVSVALMPTGPSLLPFPEDAFQGLHLENGYDARMPGKPLLNTYGFPIDPATIPQGAEASAEGYFARDDNKFVAFLVEVAGGMLIDGQVPAISIQRAQCRQRTPTRIELEVRGAAHKGTARFGTAVRATFVPGDGISPAPTQYGNGVNITQDAEDVQFGIYRYTYDAANVTGGCPAVIKARFPGATPNTWVMTSATVDIRAD
jgi:hypothetical protein